MADPICRWADCFTSRLQHPMPDCWQMHCVTVRTTLGSGGYSPPLYTLLKSRSLLKGRTSLYHESTIPRPWPALSMGVPRRAPMNGNFSVCLSVCLSESAKMSLHGWQFPGEQLTHQSALLWKDATKARLRIACAALRQGGRDTKGRRGLRAVGGDHWERFWQALARRTLTPIRQRSVLFSMQNRTFGPERWRR
jgi:hypothetical protein